MTTPNNCSPVAGCPATPCSASSDTPETDVFEDGWDSYNAPLEATEFARTLERERNQLGSALKIATDYMAKWGSKQALETLETIRASLTQNDKGHQRAATESKL